MKRRIIIISITVFAGLLGAYLIFGVLKKASGSTSSGITKHKLTNKSEKIVIKIDEDSKYPFSMDLKMTGKINGVGILSFQWTDNDTSYKKDTIVDNFNVEYKGDWYSDSCIIKYEPISGTKGDLIIDYKMFNLK